MSDTNVSWASSSSGVTLPQGLQWHFPPCFHSLCLCKTLNCELFQFATTNCHQIKLSRSLFNRLSKLECVGVDHCCSSSVFYSESEKSNMGVGMTATCVNCKEHKFSFTVTDKPLNLMTLLKNRRWVKRCCDSIKVLKLNDYKWERFKKQAYASGNVTSASHPSPVFLFPLRTFRCTRNCVRVCLLSIPELNVINGSTGPGGLRNCLVAQRSLVKSREVPQHLYE